MSNLPATVAFEVVLDDDGWTAVHSGSELIVTQSMPDMSMESILLDAVSTHFGPPYEGMLTIRITDKEDYISQGLHATKWLLNEATKTLRHLATEPEDYAVEIAGLLENLCKYIDKTGDII